LSATEFLPSLTAGLQAVEGVCAEHGARAVTIRPGMAWYCPQCLEAELKHEYAVKWAEKRHSDLFTVATIPQKYRGQRFVATTPEQKHVRGTCKAFRDHITQGPKWAALVLMGEFGTGKTLLACELAESLIEKFGLSVRYVTAQAMVSEIQAAYRTEGKSEETELMRFAQFDVLVIDEIDAKRDSDNANLLLTEVINRRYNAEKPVVVITNQPFDGLAKFVGGRVHSRLHENAFVCSFDWQDFRKGAA
jgi:DNA replication protein DnaC